MVCSIMWEIFQVNQSFLWSRNGISIESRTVLKFMTIVVVVYKPRLVDIVFNVLL